jgi:hypothetical protein
MLGPGAARRVPVTTKPGRKYTHGLLASGTCPWCHVPIVDGFVRPDVAPRDAAVRRWNIEAMLKVLDSPDEHMLPSELDRATV